MSATDFPPLFLPNGGFFFPFLVKDTKCFAFSSFLDEVDLNDSLRIWLADNDAALEFVDQSTFLFLSFYTSNYYSLRPEYQNRRAASEIIGTADDVDYQGHDVDDLIGYYRPTFVLSIPPDNVLADADPYIVATELLAMIPSLRSPIIDDDFAGRVHALLSNPSIIAESLFLSLTSTRWRYAYLELFRVIESILYVPWVNELTGDLGIDVDIRELYSCLRKNLDWREGKGKSVERVFSNLRMDADLLGLETQLQSLRDLNLVHDTDRAVIGKRVYKIRNQLVHPEDFTDRSVLNTAEDEFRSLAIYLCAVALQIYSEYDSILRRRRNS